MPHGIVWLSRKTLARLLILSIVVFFLAEASARWFGFGDPPLLLADPDIEYMFAPNQDCTRFGNAIHYNAFGMRSANFPVAKSSPEELRVLVVGDSVINGGNPTDQAELATELMKATLRKKHGNTVVTGNISAGSWGPENQRQYLKKFGWFDADVVVFVWSSHDLEDDPTYQDLVGLDPSMPSHKPMFAISEVVLRYLLPRFFQAKIPKSHRLPEFTATEAIDGLLLAAHEHGARVVVVHHLTRAELNGIPDIRGDTLLSQIKAKADQVVDTRSFYEESKAIGKVVYRDSIHLTADGQQALSRAILEGVESIMSDRIDALDLKAKE